MTSTLPSVRNPKTNPKPARKWQQKLGQATHAKQRSLQQEIQRLEKRLQKSGNSHASDRPSSAPSVVMEQKLLNTMRSLISAQYRDLTRMDVVCSRILLHSAQLDTDVTDVARLAAAEGSLLLLAPTDLQARISALAEVLGLPMSDALALATREPSVLTRYAPVLRESLSQLAAVMKSRGLPSLRETALLRPDILTCSAAGVAAKLDALPAALGGVSPKVVRELVSQCPGLLRRSVASVQERYQMLQSLLVGIPKSYVSELVVSTPQLLELSPPVMKAKFQALMKKYGAFQSDVVDVVLVDPQQLLTVDPRQPSTSGSARIRAGGSTTVRTQPPATATATSPSSQAGTDTTAPSGAPDVPGISSTTQHTGEGDSNAAPAAAQATPVHAPVSDIKPVKHAQTPASQRGTAAQGRWRSTVDRVVGEAAAVGIPLYDALQLYSGRSEATLVADASCSVDSGDGGDSELQGLEEGPQGTGGVLTQAGYHTVLWQAADTEPYLFGRLQRLAAGLGVPRGEARALVARCPLLLTLTARAARQRLAALTSLLAEGASHEHQALGLLQKQPELLLQTPTEIQGRVAALQQCLGVSAAQAMVLLERQPRLLLLPSRHILEQLKAITTMLGNVSPSVMVELISKEPALLETPIQVLQTRFDDIVSAFGSFIDDALGVVLADPKTLLRVQRKTVQPARMPAADEGVQVREAAATSRAITKQESGTGAPRKRGRPRKNNAGDSEVSVQAGADTGSRDAQSAAMAALDDFLFAESEVARVKQAETRERRRRQRSQSAPQEPSARDD